jgi:hypothetical protein
MPYTTCCPDAYLCPASGDLECPRHSGFTVCCDRPDEHVPQDRDTWHRQQETLERDWLDSFIRTGHFVATAGSH